MAQKQKLWHPEGSADACCDALHTVTNNLEDIRKPYNRMKMAASDFSAAMPVETPVLVTVTMTVTFVEDNEDKQQQQQPSSCSDETVMLSRSARKAEWRVFMLLQDYVSCTSVRFIMLADRVNRVMVLFIGIVELFIAIYISKCAFLSFN